MNAPDGLSGGAADAPALSVLNVRKSFAGVEVLRGVDLVVRPGTVHSLVGHNGSGKSTLIKALAGFHAPDVPVIGSAFGRSFTVGDHSSAAAAGLRFVHQDLGLVEGMTAVDNLALGTGFPRRRVGTVRWREARRRTRAAMEALGYDIDITAPVGALSAAERAGVAIARALEGWSGDPAVVVLDEPTAAMPAPEVRRLFEAVDRLRRRGLGVVYVSHHLDEVLQLADDVTVLRSGEVVMHSTAEGLTHDALVTKIVGRELARTMRTPPPANDLSSGLAALEVSELSTAGLHGISFAVAQGEIVGFAGILGSGRDQVLPAVAGAATRGGIVKIGTTTVPANRPKVAIRAGLGLVPANRRKAAVLPSFSASGNFTVSGVRKYSRLGWLSPRAEEKDVNGWFGQMDVAPRNPEAPILTLSGGNQQKVMVGRWLRRAPLVLALDEPTQGVDVGAKETIYLALQAAANNGNGVLVSSSDGDELAAVCHRVLVLVRGRVVAELVGDEIDAEVIDSACLEAHSGVNQ